MVLDLNKEIKHIFSVRQCWENRYFSKYFIEVKIFREIAGQCFPDRQINHTVVIAIWRHIPVKNNRRSIILETQTCLIPPIAAPTPHRHRALFREIGIIKVTFELSSPSSAHGITHNDIQCSPDHIYDSIFDTAVHQQRITPPKRINPLFFQFKHNPFSSVNHLSLYCKCNCSDLKERGG